MRPSPIVVAALTCASLALAPRSSVDADPPVRDDTIHSAQARLATYEELLHASGIPGIDPSTARGRTDWDVLHYTLHLTPNFDQRSLSGIVEVEFAARIDGLQTVQLDLYDDLDVAWVRQDGQSLAFYHTNDVLVVTLSAPLGSGDVTSITINYAGEPGPAGPLGFAWDVTPAGRPTLATISEPFYARSWWPCKDTSSDKATVDLRVAVPAQNFVAAGGTLAANVVAGDLRAQHWAMSYPTTTYNVSLAVTEYASWSEDYVSPEGNAFPIEYHVFPEHEDIARYEFGRVDQMLDFFSSIYGPYAFHAEKYGMAEVVLAGAMEHQTMTSYGDFFMTGDRYYEGIVAHELSHHWWGNLITIDDWNDLWLHEGLATFSDGLWREHIDGRNEYLRFLRQRSAGCCGFAGPISPPVKMFNQTVYQKGAWMLHMLRELVGDEDFFAALRRLTSDEELRFGNFGETDFVEAMEAQTGLQLDWFFDQWLHRTGRPEIRIEWWTPDARVMVQSVQVEIQQVQDGPDWWYPLRLRVTDDSGPRDLDLFITNRTTTLTLPVDGVPSAFEIDPDQQLLHFDRGVERIYPGPEDPVDPSPPDGHIDNSPNPFNPRTNLRFTIAEARHVRIGIYDVRGRVIDEIDCGWLEPGTHSRVWDGTDRRGESVASGTYFVRVEGSHAPARRITLVR